MIEEKATNLPADWTLVPLGALMRFQNGFNTDKTAYGRGLRFANVLEVITNTHLSAELIPGRVATSSAETTRYLVQRGDILFNRTSETQEEVGLASVYLDDEPILFGGFVLRGKPVSDALDPVFAGYGLRSKIVRQQIMAAGQGGIRANIGQQSLSKINIALPNKSEQVAIAEALSDADALIEGLERVIAKKRLIKQGAMQELLTAKRRLPGFSGEWVDASVSECARISRIGSNPANEPEQVFEHYSLPAFDAGQIPTFEKGKEIQSNKFRVPEGSLIVSKLNPRIPRVWAPSIQSKWAVCSTEFIVLVPNERVQRSFLRQTFLSPQMVDEMTNRATGTTGSHQRIAPGIFAALMLRIPSEQEQRAIVSILDDMDAEIQALETRLEKARSVKEGMMQNLLTGRIRLV